MRSRDEGKIGAIVWRVARSTRGMIDERARRTIAPLIDRTCRSTSDAIDEWCDRRRSLFFLSLSLSLSLSLFPKIVWSENESVKLFSGQRSKCWATRNDFPENFIFRCCQTRGFGGKWFSKIIFPQNKCTLNVRKWVYVRTHFCHSKLVIWQVLTQNCVILCIPNIIL